MLPTLKPCPCGRLPKLSVKEVCKEIYPNSWYLQYGCTEFDHSFVGPQTIVEVTVDITDLHSCQEPIDKWNSIVKSNVPDDFITAVLHGDDKHREWLKNAQVCYNKGRPIPTVR